MEESFLESFDSFLLKRVFQKISNLLHRIFKLSCFSAARNLFYLHMATAAVVLFSSYLVTGFFSLLFSLFVFTFIIRGTGVAVETCNTLEQRVGDPYIKSKKNDWRKVRITKLAFALCLILFAFICRIPLSLSLVISASLLFSVAGDYFMVCEPLVCKKKGN